jgi:alpha-2-macroglobulin
MARAARKAETLAEMEGAGEEDLRLRSYATFLLTRSGVITTRYLESLRKDLEKYNKDWKSDLTGMYMASSYTLLQMDLEAGAILREIRTKVRRETFADGYNDKLSYLSQYLIILSRYAPERLKQVSSELLDAIASELKANHFTTFSASMALVGLQSYVDATEKLDDRAIAILQILKNDSSMPVDLEGDVLKSGDFVPETARLEVQNSSGQPLYYQIVQGGFDRTSPDSERSEGIEILREFLDQDGKPVESMVLGQSYQVRLRIRATSRGTIRNTAIVDLLPACLEPQRELIRSEGNLSRGDNAFRPDYLDIREDRLVLYGTVDQDLHEYTYPVRAVYSGTFRVPPLFAEAMYDNAVWALQGGAEMTVGEASF